jgi:hypothetical protein
MNSNLRISVDIQSDMMLIRDLGVQMILEYCARNDLSSKKTVRILSFYETCLFEHYLHYEISKHLAHIVLYCLYEEYGLPKPDFEMTSSTLCYLYSCFKKYADEISTRSIYDYIEKSPKASEKYAEIKKDKQRVKRFHNKALLLFVLLNRFQYYEKLECEYLYPDICDFLVFDCENPVFLLRTSVDVTQYSFVFSFCTNVKFDTKHLRKIMRLV